jgi:lipopolysaccharide export system protein LptC
VRYQSISDDGVEVLATASRGVATGDGERITLMGNVHVVREVMGAKPRLELRGERVIALQSQERLLSDVPVVITRDRDRFTASRMDFDMKSGQYQLSGRVHGVLQAREP